MLAINKVKIPLVWSKNPKNLSLCRMNKTPDTWNCSSCYLSKTRFYSAVEPTSASRPQDFRPDRYFPVASPFMYLSKREEAILQSIPVASLNDPSKPEFPPLNPKFPATPTRKMEVPGLNNVWLKDESTNPTGTHKDRIGWEIVATYRDILLAKKRGAWSGPLPSMSIISSGSAAIAIQTQLRQYNLPALKVLVDSRMDRKILKYLKGIGCQVYQTDLSKAELGWSDILTLTNNKDGLDITSSKSLDPSTRFYDWMAYEIINESPEYCFVPFGSGTLFENILNVSKQEVSSSTQDPRFRGDINALSRCHFYGAATSNPKSLAAAKLYSPHLPFAQFDEHWLRLFKLAGYCGKDSGIEQIQEECLLEAIELAEKQNIVAEPSALAGLALLLQFKSKIRPDKKVLVVSTGCTIGELNETLG